jgi:2-polyprenyl-6-methoxyphenol hydroxylase-like FAD-dependent oxidoreductase
VFDNQVDVTSDPQTPRRSNPELGPEHVDVVIVGARCAGSAAAVHFARHGRRVVVLDKARFPSDTLSTHAMMIDGVAELARMGALEKILSLNPTRTRFLTVASADVMVREQWPSLDGINYSLCVPRPEQDLILVQTARAAGADVRERCAVEDVVWAHGRVVGVRYRQNGRTRELRAKLVVGADGRRSTIAGAVGSWRPYRFSLDKRGLVYGYTDEPLPDTQWAETLSLWRSNGRIAATFPCTPRGRLLTVFLPPNEELIEWRRAPREMWEREPRQFPAAGFPTRIDGVAPPERIRTAGDLVSYFRVSSGSGWVLVGDSGHFKDPVIGRGMSDALHFARRLAERTAGVLEDPARLDNQLRQWERERDHCLLPTYHFGNRQGRAHVDSPLVEETLRTFVRNELRADVSVVFTRQRTPERVFGPSHLVRALASALRRPDTRTTEVLHETASELRSEIGIRVDRLARLPTAARRTRHRATERAGAHFPPNPY